MKLKHLTAAAVGLLFAAPMTFAADGAGILKAQCISCHATAKPANLGIEHIWERKAPDLYYAGTKFNQPWLVKWLQTPTRIRPAGEFYTKHVKASGDAVDVIDTSTLQDHMKLSKEDAEAVATALMALTDDSLIEKGAYKGEKVSATMGAMFFNKLRGCAACHSAKPGTGGLSGAELYTAAERLNPDFVYSFIKHPQKVDPGIWMPELKLSEPDLQRLTGYILQLNPTEGK